VAAAPDRVRLAVTLGDPRGIGPEVVRKALADPRVTRRVQPVVVGPGGTELSPDEDVGRWRAGGGAAAAGRLAGLAIERAVRLAQSGAVSGVVTAPIDKAALLAGGYDYPGHTEMLAQLAGADVAMMLASSTLRVVLATTHIPLRDVPDAVTGEAIERAARVTRDGLRRARSTRTAVTAAASAARTTTCWLPRPAASIWPAPTRPTPSSCGRCAVRSTP
jgi:4-hydroxythreonine-4-phosphate dehydrogenase